MQSRRTFLRAAAALAGSTVALGAATRVSAQQKVIFRLRHYEDFSLEEIADHLGLRAGTVRAHLFRAIHKVRRELAAWRSQGGSDEAALQ